MPVHTHTQTHTHILSRTKSHRDTQTQTQTKKTCLGPLFTELLPQTAFQNKLTDECKNKYMHKKIFDYLE